MVAKLNADEVVEMLDAITSGREFSTNWTPMAGEKLHILTRDDSFVIGMGNVPNIVSLGDPRTAREIAGALVAWANRKESQPDSGLMEIVDPGHEAGPSLRIVKE